MDHTIVYLSLAFIVGYVVGSIDSIKRAIRIPSVNVEAPESFVSSLARDEKQQASKRKKISIDETKFVTDVVTDGMQSKSSNPLGVVTQSSDDISSATNKLAQLKKLKG